MDSKYQNPVKAIRAYCLECSGGSYAEVERCKPVNGCQLWEFRMGKNPYRTPRKVTEEQRQAFISRMHGKSNFEEETP